MAASESITSLRRAFETGADPLSYIPYAQALRRARYYSQAIDVCVQGISKSGGSVAGRTLLGRLYCDVGNYEDSARTLREAAAEAPEAIGPRIALAQTLLRMHEIEEAEGLIERLNTENPLDPEVQLLNTALRRLRAARRAPGATGGAARAREAPPTSLEETLEAMLRRFEKLGETLGVVFGSHAEAFEPMVAGHETEMAPWINTLREIRQAYRDLEMGTLVSAQFDLEKGLVFYGARGDEYVALILRPVSKAGNLRNLFDQCISSFLPFSHDADTVAPEEEK